MNQKPHEDGTDKTIFLQRPPLNVPLDLSEWVAPELLVTWIKEAIENLDRRKPEVQAFLDQPTEARADVTLSVLAFAYCTQLYASSEIASLCRSDSLLQRLCGGEGLYAEDLERFRRQHRTLLEHVVGQMLSRAVREKFLQSSQLPPGLQHSLFNRAVTRLDTAQHMDSGEE